MDDIVIVSAVRTPVGSFNGALGTLPAHALGAIALQAAFWATCWRQAMGRIPPARPDAQPACRTPRQHSA
jgi:hypothetical protein